MYLEEGVVGGKERNHLLGGTDMHNLLQINNVTATKTHIIGITQLQCVLDVRKTKRQQLLGVAPIIHAGVMVFCLELECRIEFYEKHFVTVVQF